MRTLRFACCTAHLVRSVGGSFVVWCCLTFADQTKSLWRKWSFTAPVGARNCNSVRSWRRVEYNVTQDDGHSRLSNGSNYRCTLYTLFAFLLKQESAAYDRSVDDGNGLHARQALLSLRHPVVMLNQLLGPRSTVSYPRVNLRHGG